MLCVTELRSWDADVANCSAADVGKFLTDLVTKHVPNTTSAGLFVCWSFSFYPP